MDLYAVLGLQRVATLLEIKRAYRRLARRLHPDINPGDGDAEARFRLIAEAYEVLSDLDRRRKYDASGTFVQGPAADPRTYGFEGFDFSVSVTGDHSTTFGDLFSEMFDRRTTEGSPEPSARGADLHVPLSTTFEEAMVGGEAAVIVTRQAACRICRGAGAVRTEVAACPACQGTGSVRTARGHMVFSKVCSHCRGSGSRRQTACVPCAGRGLETRSETLRVRLPKGVADGARVRVAGKGNVGAQGGEPGDLVVQVHVQPHPLFRRDGDNIHITVPVAIHEAALGGRIDVPTLDGPARVRLPPGTQAGQRIRLRHRGVSRPDGRHGDLVVEIRLVLPEQLDERSKELLREFGRLNAGDVRRDLHAGRTSSPERSA